MCTDALLMYLLTRLHTKQRKVVRACKPSTWEVEAEQPGVAGQEPEQPNKIIQPSRKTTNAIADAGKYLSIIILNTNSLNSPTKI